MRNRLHKTASALAGLVLLGSVFGCAAQNPNVRGRVDTDINQSSGTTPDNQQDNRRDSSGRYK
jgi:hypothetical protein